MKIRFIAQPQENIQLGSLLKDSLSEGKIRAVTIISAFVSRATIIRLKDSLIKLHNAKAKIRIVVGVDMGGTSKEVLDELSNWPVEVFIFKNRKNGVTFHPKIYLIEKDNSAEVYIGSNNLTEGGLFKNYEGTAIVKYELPKDLEPYNEAKAELSKFLNPGLPVAKQLDKAFLEKLLLRSDIPSDAEARARAKKSRIVAKSDDNETFGFEATPGAKSLPIEYQDIVLAAVNQQLSDIKKFNRELKRKNKGIEDSSIVKTSLPEIEPIACVPATAFYMELNATKGAKGNIPGEQRVPLPAIWSAQEFWGWRENYTKDINPRKGKKQEQQDESKVDRIYYNWHAKWEILQIGNPSNHVPSKIIRMYFYENSSDFRFTCGEIAKWGDPGDIVKIEKIDNGFIDFKCQLAKKGTKEHAAWSLICKNNDKSHSKRGYGFS
ncbi:hypothetical protein IPC692_11945 [Pseudomonas aeruginosa]|uniref:phospholipase D-like domain-containing protein n=1 Tax=Pseudomonas aeruginosa TaxID=287 RepID=UPI000F546EE2|nr:phospholipase D family protein [Pseudomonas aeruginosa]MDA3276324.1 phospholipase D family protein [Pseudomonas aeruginosa]RPY41080.1 hypothetical protein IPC692_11945 [Pseudomonas aeruginosa]RPY51061.1 hypothetical protein IPC688_09300 [Pseudomonas aeruginosa]WCV92965.1 phospholipase D family protein [Pseudomonas aeruginosa]WCV98611.1 phospholipase D family protein [Pseudomonas aeruginosa]